MLSLLESRQAPLLRTRIATCCRCSSRGSPPTSYQDRHVLSLLESRQAPYFVPGSPPCCRPLFLSWQELSYRGFMGMFRKGARMEDIDVLTKVKAKYCRPVALGYVVCSRDSTRILGKLGMPPSPAPVMWVRQSRQYHDLE